MRYWWALLAFFALGWLGAQAQDPDLSGRWVGTFPGSPTTGLELRLEHQPGDSYYRGFASMNPAGPPGTGTWLVAGELQPDGNLQLTAATPGSKRFATLVINAVFQGQAGQADIYSVGNRRIASVTLTRMNEERVAPVGRAYRLEPKDREGRPIAATVQVSLGEQASGQYTLTGSRFSLGKGARTGTCTVFTPRFDPGMLIFLLREPSEDWEFWPLAARVPAFFGTGTGAQLSYTNLCATEFEDPRRVAFLGNAFLETP